MDIHSVIIKPLVTEKSTNMQASRKYSFIVRKEATKIDIRNAVEKLYGVSVSAVNIVKIKPKTRLIRRGRATTKRRSQKKGVVSIQKGTLDVNKIK